LIRRLIVDTEIPRILDTSYMLKKGRFSWFIVLGICWEDISIS